MQNENNKNETLKESKTSPWLDWAVKLQAIAQAGLTYGKDVYDRERYEQIRDIAAEMISLHSGISKEKVVDLFQMCIRDRHESAFVTAHVFHGEVPEKLVIDLPEGCPNTIAEVYAPTAITAKVEGRQLIITPSEEMEAISVLLK